MGKNIEAEQTVLALALAVEEGDKEAFDALWNQERSAEEWKQLAGQAIKLFQDAVGYFQDDLLPGFMEFAREPERIKREVELFRAAGWDMPELKTFSDWFLHTQHPVPLAVELKDHIQSLARDAGLGVADNDSLEEAMAWRLERKAK